MSDPDREGHHHAAAALNLASYHRCLDRIRTTWPVFRAKRDERLMQQERHGVAAEKVAENILEDLFTAVLDWSLGDLNNQIEYADLVLTRLGIKYLLIEVKRPGALAWNRRAVEAALDQAQKYADQQGVRCVGVSDGFMLYAADIDHGVLRGRICVRLDHAEPQEDLWWLSEHGIYRPREDAEEVVLRLLSKEAPAADPGSSSAPHDGQLLHHRYKLPCHCFGYVGDASDPSTWKLPYCHADGSIDASRLPKAIQAILTNYRGATVHGIPEKAIPGVLARLEEAARQAGKMPDQSPETATVYHQLAEVLAQLRREIPR